MRGERAIARATDVEEHRPLRGAPRAARTVGSGTGARRVVVRARLHAPAEHNDVVSWRRAAMQIVVDARRRLVGARRGDVDVALRSRAAIRRVLQTLQSGKALILFPEGTRSPDGNLQSAKAGVGLIACKTQAPVLPARIFNSHEAFGRGGKMRPGTRVSVSFGPLIHPENYDDPSAGRDRYQRASERIMAAIAELSEPVYPVI